MKTKKKVNKTGKTRKIRQCPTKEAKQFQNITREGEFKKKKVAYKAFD